MKPKKCLVCKKIVRSYNRSCLCNHCYNYLYALFKKRKDLMLIQ